MCCVRNMGPSAIYVICLICVDMCCSVYRMLCLCYYFHFKSTCKMQKIWVQDKLYLNVYIIMYHTASDLNFWRNTLQSDKTKIKLFDHKDCCYIFSMLKHKGGSIMLWRHVEGLTQCSKYMASLRRELKLYFNQSARKLIVWS